MNDTFISSLEECIHGDFFRFLSGNQSFRPLSHIVSASPKPWNSVFYSFKSAINAFTELGIC